MIEAILVALAAIVAAAFAGFRSGVNRQKRKADTDNLESMRKAREIRRDVESLDDDDSVDEFDRLREQRRR